MADLDTPEPLADWLMGTLTLVFSHGATVTRHVPLATATEVRQVAAGTREADRLHWCETGWLQFDREQLMFVDFALDEDGGWTLSAEERRALDRTPYRRGVLVALRDYWQGMTGREAAYSARALLTMHNALQTNPPHDFWTRMARDFEGEAGAERARRFSEKVAERHDEAAARDEDSPADPSTGTPSHGAAPGSDDLTYTEPEGDPSGSAPHPDEGTATASDIAAGDDDTDAGDDGAARPTDE